ncbi:hypothetical protein [Shimia sp.]|uniref:hypothetical protein n=1 Tax=Shimia sp. TaxID=1954381 RepID=UPI0032972FC8
MTQQTQNPALAALRARVSGAIERGDAEPVVAIDAPASLNDSEYDAETLAEVAACLWESVLDADPGATPDPAAEGWQANMQRKARAEGMAALRSHVIGYAADAESGWSLAQGSGFDSPFDWEFVPRFVAACIDWKNGGLVANWRGLCRQIGDRDSVDYERDRAALEARGWYEAAPGEWVQPCPSGLGASLAGSIAEALEMGADADADDSDF